MQRIRSYNSPWSLDQGLVEKTMTDVEVPDFHARRDGGELISNPMASFIYVAGIKPASVTFRMVAPKTWKKPAKNTLYSRTVNYMVYGANSSLWPGYASAWLDNRKQTYALDGRLSDVDEAHTGLSSELATGVASVLVTLAEGHKTIRMLKDAYDFVRRPLRDSAKLAGFTGQWWKDPKKRERVIDSASNAWLQGRYGWRPFIYDVMSMVDASSTDIIYRRTERGGFVPDEVSTSYQQIFANLYPIDGVGRLQYKVVGDVILHAKVSFGQTADFRIPIQNAGYVWGAYSLTNVIWEIIPYSFVVDWFINLGDAFNALWAYALIQERIGWTKFQLDMSATLKDVRGPSSFYLDSEERTYSLIYETPSFQWTERATLVQRTVPTSFMPVIGFRNHLDVLKLVDMAALLRNLVKGPRT